MSSHASSNLAPPEQEVSDQLETIRRHGVPELPELLSIIFSYLGRAELARAARVCKTWSPLALDYLWEHIDDLPELFCVYSSPRIRSLHSPGFSFKYTPDGFRLDEFWAYARRIRIVSWCQSSYELDVIPHLLRRVREAGYGQTFLPNLRQITFTGFQSSGHCPRFSCIFPSMPATLESLSFKLYTEISPKTCMAILQALFSVSMKHLKWIELGSGIPTSAESNHLFATFIRHQQHLESLRGFSIALETEDLRYIGHLPCLIELDLYHTGDPDRGLAEACSAIADQFPKLRKLSLLNTSSRTPDVSVLEGLAPCRDLRAITLTCTDPRAVDAEAIQRLGRGWPQLEELCFKPFYQRHVETKYEGAPIKVLEDVALCWSETITTVSLVFDASDGVPEPSEVKGRFKRLRRIIVDHCILPDNQVRPVAEFIAVMCTEPPDLEYDRRAKMRGDWVAVQKEVRTIIEGRRT